MLVVLLVPLHELLWCSVFDLGGVMFDIVVVIVVVVVALIVLALVVIFW